MFSSFFRIFALSKKEKNKMKRISTYWILLGTLLMILACGEDRTYEYEEKTQHNHWMYDVMLEKYLWAEALASFEPSWKNYFSAPAQFMATLTGKSGQKDSWSYVEIDTVNADSHKRGNFNHIDSYGFDFVLMTDPTGSTTKSFLRVITVYPGSPAERSGLKRNDYISSFDSYKISKKNITKLQQGPSRELEICHLAENEIDGSLFWSDTAKIAIGTSEYVEDVAFPVSKVITEGGKRIGYLMCTRLLDAPEEQPYPEAGVYRRMLDDAMMQMKAADVEEMVLDLRLCNDGTIDMAQRLASYVVAPQQVNSMFARTLWNASNAANNKEYPYDASVDNLGLERVYVIIGSYTRGAAEWLIHALQHTMGVDKVVLIGKPTAGQNVMTEQVAHAYNIRLYPVVAYVADGGGNYDYGSKTPAVEVDEFGYLQLGEYGTLDEILLYTAVDDMLNGSHDGSIWD